MCLTLISFSTCQVSATLNETHPTKIIKEKYSRGLNTPFPSSKLTHKELNSTFSNTSLQEGHSLIFVNHT